jgi:CRISPR-associated protein Cmr2
MDLVMVAISGVQRFIAEARSTADLDAGSGLMSELAAAMVDAVQDPDELVLPAGRTQSRAGTPNRVVAVAKGSRGQDLAKAMADAAYSAWEARLESTFRGSSSAPPTTPGFPAVQWAAVPLAEGGYQDAWAQAQEALTARKRVRDFPGFHTDVTAICTLTGRWPAVPPAQIPRSVSYALRRGEALSAAGHVKRSRGARFPSTWSIATAPYRDAIIQRGVDAEALWLAVDYLKDAVEALRESGDQATQTKLQRGSGELPGLPHTDDQTMRWLRQIEGSWCIPETWEPSGLRRDHDLAADPDKKLCASGAKATADLRRVAHDSGIPPPAPYLAVLTQDADEMGKQLGAFSKVGTDPAQWHVDVSAALGKIAHNQATEIGSSTHLGRVVYAGGDDLLALVPADRALGAARAVNRLLAQDAELTRLLDRPSASTALVFFHASWPLQSAIAAAQTLLKDAKERARPGLGVALLTRGGERARLVMPWFDRSMGPDVEMASYLQELVAATTGHLSGRLATGLETDQDELASLGRVWLERELSRRAARHGMAQEQAPAVGRILAALCGGGDPGERDFTGCAESVLIARFLAGLVKVSP